MQIHIWNAFASNNSGAYTIVGTFASQERAREVVAMLNPVLEAQTRWHESNARESPDAPSPLRAFARAEGVPLDDEWIDWPEYGDDNSPRAVAIGSQVVLHHHYTVSLPRFFGHWFYQRGGRVERELDHTHHRLVTRIDVWWSNDSSEPGTREERARIVLDRLMEQGGPIVRFATKTIEPAWRLSDQWLEAPLRVGVCFDDLVAGVAAVQDVLQRFRAHGSVQILEAFEEAGDPLAFMRTAGG